MKRIFIFFALFLLLSSAAAWGLDTQTRAVGPVRTWSRPDLDRFHDDLINVKFVEGSDVRALHHTFVDDDGRDLSLTNQALGRASVAEIRRTFDVDRATLREWKAVGEARTGKVGPDLSLWFTVRVEGGASEVARLVNALNASPSVEIAHPVPIVEPAVIRTAGDPAPPGRLPTPDFTDMQDYLYDPPVGLDGPAAWAMPGGYGEGMKFIDVELCWTEDHEDFDYDSFFHEGGAPQNPGYETHGTAVLGEVIGQHNGFGISGFAPAVEYGVVAIDIDDYPEVSVYFFEAMDTLDEGDVWLIELQMYPPDRSATPMEWLQVNYDVIWTSSWSRNVICVEAGANGSQDLDDPSWDGVFDRNVRDSGAIMVGAGTPTGRVAESFTNYGSRMDVHAWGSQIVTTGYGDLYDGGTLQTCYTSGFGGTSGASPMVVGSALCLQGIARVSAGYPFTPELIRSILNETGIPHLDPSKEIGPRPDLAAAAAEVLTYGNNPYLSIQAIAIDDDDSGQSHGNGNGIPEFGETIELVITLENLGQVDATGVQGQLACDDEFVAVTSGAASFGDIPSGGTAQNALPFVYTVSGQVPDQHEVTFHLGVSEPPEDLQFTQIFAAPMLSVLFYEVNDDVGGNGNGIPEPGEDVVLDITVVNSGSIGLTEVTGTLGGGPHVEADPTPIPFGTIDPSGSVAGGPFPVSISIECPALFSSLLLFTLEAAEPYELTTTFTFNIGDFFGADMEDGAADWIHYEGQSGYPDEWHLETYRNHTYGGATSWKFGGAGAADYSNAAFGMLESPPFTLPAGSQLGFWHWIDAETSSAYPGYCYDGGRLELMIEDGPWEVITPDGDYPYLIRGTGNPLGEGTAVFSGVHDWEEALFDLGNHSGSARIRFVFASDNGVTREGWYVDDVRLIKPFSDASEQVRPLPLRLHPARPNPMASATTLRLDLPRSAPARVRIYDAAGRCLRTLVDGMLPAGQHPLHWDGRDASGTPAAAGLYWARVAIEDQERAMRIVVVR